MEEILEGRTSEELLHEARTSRMPLQGEVRVRSHGPRNGSIEKGPRNQQTKCWNWFAPAGSFLAGPVLRRAWGKNELMMQVRVGLSPGDGSSLLLEG